MELVDGYGVYLSKRQLDEAVDQSCSSATRLIRSLLAVFFSPSILAGSSCLGTRKCPGLNPNIIGACFSKYYALVNHAWYRYMQPPCLVGVMRVQPSGRFPIIVSTAIANTNCTIETMVDYNIYLGMILCYVVHTF